MAAVHEIPERLAGFGDAEAELLIDMFGVEWESEGDGAVVRVTEKEVRAMCGQDGPLREKLEKILAGRAYADLLVWW